MGFGVREEFIVSALKSAYGYRGYSGGALSGEVFRSRPLWHCPLCRLDDQCVADNCRNIPWVLKNSFSGEGTRLVFSGGVRSLTWFRPVS